MQENFAIVYSQTEEAGKKDCKISVLLGNGTSCTGCSAARLARFVRDEEAGSSNLPIPTFLIPLPYFSFQPFFIAKFLA